MLRATGRSVASGRRTSSASSSSSRLQGNRPSTDWSGIAERLAGPRAARPGAPSPRARDRAAARRGVREARPDARRPHEPLVGLPFDPGAQHLRGRAVPGLAREVQQHVPSVDRVLPVRDRGRVRRQVTRDPRSGFPQAFEAALLQRAEALGQAGEQGRELRIGLQFGQVRGQRQPPNAVPADLGREAKSAFEARRPRPSGPRVRHHSCDCRSRTATMLRESASLRASSQRRTPASQASTSSSGLAAVGRPARRSKGRLP